MLRIRIILTNHKFESPSSCAQKFNTKNNSDNNNNNNEPNKNNAALSFS